MSIFVQVVTAYMVVDFVWVWFQPQCVPAPAIVLPHHIATVMILSHPLRFPRHDGFAALVMLVETQTFFLIVRRYFKSSLAGRPLLAKCIGFVYWPSAIATRLLIHPWALVDSIRRLWRTPAEMCLVWHSSYARAFKYSFRDKRMPARYRGCARAGRI